MPATDERETQQLRESTTRATARLAELEQKTIGSAATPRIEDTGCVVVLGVLQQVRLRFQHETGRPHLSLDELRIDAMQALDVAGPGRGGGSVVDETVDATRLEGLEDLFVHASPIDLHPIGVVIELHHEDGVEFAWRKIEIFQLAIETDDVAEL